MKALLLFTMVLSLPLGSKTLKCYSCVASSEEECYRQGTHVCPQYAEVCSTITAPRGVLELMIRPPQSPDLILTQSVWDYMKDWNKSTSTEHLYLVLRVLPKTVCKYQEELMEDSIIKSCSYKSFCDHARQNGNGASVECCFSDDCNGPPKGNSAGLKNSASCPALPPVLLFSALLIMRPL